MSNFVPYIPKSNKACLSHIQNNYNKYSNWLMDWALQASSSTSLYSAKRVEQWATVTFFNRSKWV